MSFKKWRFSKRISSIYIIEWREGEVGMDTLPRQCSPLSERADPYEQWQGSDLGLAAGGPLRRTRLDRHLTLPLKDGPRCPPPIRPATQSDGRPQIESDTGWDRIPGRGAGYRCARCFTAILSHSHADPPTLFTPVSSPDNSIRIQCGIARQALFFVTLSGNWFRVWSSKLKFTLVIGDMIWYWWINFFRFDKVYLVYGIAHVFIVITFHSWVLLFWIFSPCTKRIFFITLSDRIIGFYYFGNWSIITYMPKYTDIWH